VRVRIGARGVSVALGACLAGAAIAWLVSTPIKVERVSIRGMRMVAAGEIKRILNVRPGLPVGHGDVRRMESELERHAAFESASVSRGLTGTLHVRLVEREPVAWMRAFRCSVAEDGTLLPHVRQRDPSWICLEGVAVKHGKVSDVDAIREALAGRRYGREVDDSGGGVWRRLRSPADAWEWETGGKRIQMTSPIREDELKRLARFRRAYPEAWARARLLDLRFADRVVVKR